METFLVLPEHVQNLIIGFAIYHERAPPANVAEAGKNGRAISRVGTRSWGYGPSNVLYETAPAQTSSASLLRTSKQLHKQTKQVLTDLFPEGPTYKLDVLLVNELQLWPTWLFVSHLAEDVKSVEVTVRVFGTLAEGKNQSAFCFGDGSPPQIEWCFYYLLDHFLQCGPTSSPKFAKRLIVRDIYVRFVVGDPAVLPDIGSRREWQEAQRSRWGSTKVSAFRNQFDSLMTLKGKNLNYAIHPVWFAGMISGPTSGLLSMSYHSSEYGTILLENVERFHFASLADKYSTIDVGRAFPSISSEPESPNSVYCKDTMGHLRGDCRLLSLWNWKWNAVQLRKERGLSVSDKLEWPKLEQWKAWKEAQQREFERSKNTGYSGHNNYCLCEQTGLENWLQSSALSTATAQLQL